jgi:hypothetical protein
LHNRSRAFPIQKSCFSASHNKQQELQALFGGFASELQMPKTTKKTEGKLKAPGCLEQGRSQLVLKAA